MSRPRKILIIFVLLVPFLYWLAGKTLSEHLKKRSITVYGKNNTGLSIAYDFLKNWENSELTVLQTPLLEDESLEKQNLYLLLSPSMPLSKREMKKIESFVQRGGTLLLGIHERQMLKRLSFLLKRLNIQLSLKKNEKLVNQVTLKVHAQNNSPLFLKGETYEFYSEHFIETPKCQGTELDCFVQVVEVGAGYVLVMVGFPIFSNMLVHRSDNQKVLLRLAEFGPVLIDEYHHYFSNKQFSDLIQLPQFLLPLVGLFLIVLLYFLFGYSSFHEQDQDSEKSVSKNYHQLGEKISSSALAKSANYHSALQQHIQHLEQLFPQQRDQIDKLRTQIPTNPDKKEFFQLAGQLTLWHQSQLPHRRRAPT